ncbi:putative proton-coupled folate transporter [Apostichopus japonicus]|uniref:Putative proton-coupled folate transporter n=1 Tax=Stichopus japonicus TaxID=307972 RepID=A0A2G8L2A6_STIJA|nr:putative proton-coupled folate transporter [Apostichopus japonicus]
MPLGNLGKCRFRPSRGFVNPKIFLYASRQPMVALRLDSQQGHIPPPLGILGVTDRGRSAFNSSIMKNFLRRNVLPICLFSYIFGIVIQWPVTQNMILQRICVRDHDVSVCADINKHPEIQDKVQAEASQYMTMQSVSTDVPGAVMSLILGAASDRIGRKPVMLLPCVGLLLFAIVLLIQATSVGLWWGYLVLAGLFLGGSGGMMSFMTSISNYITDTTLEESRTERLSKTMSFMGLGAIAGMVMSGMVSDRTAFVVCIVCSIVSVSLIYCFVENVIVQKKEAKTDGSVIHEIVQNIRVGAQTLLSGSDAGKRRQLRMLIFAGMVSTGTFMAEGNIVMLYTQRSPFEWAPTTYGIFIALRQVGAVVGQVAGPILFYKLVGSRSLRNDYMLVQLTHIGCLLGATSIGMATSSTLVYFGILFIVLTGPGQPAMGSITSRLVDPSQKGTFTAFSSFLNSLSVPTSAFIFNNMYSWSVSRGIPSFVFFFYGVYSAVVVVLYGSVKPTSDEEASTKKKD